METIFLWTVRVLMLTMTAYWVFCWFAAEASDSKHDWVADVTTLAAASIVGLAITSLRSNGKS